MPPLRYPFISSLFATRSIDRCGTKRWSVRAMLSRIAERTGHYLLDTCECAFEEYGADTQGVQSENNKQAIGQIWRRYQKFTRCFSVESGNGIAFCDGRGEFCGAADYRVHQGNGKG